MRQLGQYVADPERLVPPVPVLVVAAYEQDQRKGMATVAEMGKSVWLMDDATTVIKRPTEFSASDDSWQLTLDDHLVWVRPTARNRELGYISLGRLPRSDLVFAHSAVSFMHAMIYKRGGSWWLEDRGSTNGTYLNGVLIYPQDAQELKDSDQISLARNAVRVRFFTAGGFQELLSGVARHKIGGACRTSLKR